MTPRIDTGGSMTIHRHGVKLSWRVWPCQSEIRARILAIHGWGSSAATWEPLARCLPDDIEIIAVNLRGHGDSAVARDGHSIGAMKDDCLAVLEASSLESPLIPLVVLGHSMGGNVAVRLALQLGEALTSLVLIDPAMGGDTAQVDAVAGRLADLEKLGSIAPASALRASFSASAPEDLVQSARQTMLATPAGVLRESLVSTFLDRDEVGSLAGTRRVAPLLTVPVVRVYPSEERAASDGTWGWPHGRAHVLRETGHYLHEEAPDEVANILKRTLLELDGPVHSSGCRADTK
jgi:pimeloyl-ACP methyl ester carboxylesterase